MRALWVVSVACALLAACGGQGASAGAWLEVGTGEAQFEPLQDGQEVPFVRGPQGGYHLWVSLRAGGVDRNDARLTLRSWPEAGGGPVQTSFYEEDLAPVEGEPAYERLGLLSVQPHPECLVGRRFVVHLGLEDRDGKQLESERVIVPVAGPDGGPSEPCSR